MESDLRRARLVAQAGGDRAVALAHYDGDNLLDTARTADHLEQRAAPSGGRPCRLPLLLGFMALSVFWRSFTRDRPKKRSAVYLMDEHPADLSA